MWTSGAIIKQINVKLFQSQHFPLGPRRLLWCNSMAMAFLGVGALMTKKRNKIWMTASEADQLPVSVCGGRLRAATVQRLRNESGTTMRDLLSDVINGLSCALPWLKMGFTVLCRWVKHYSTEIHNEISCFYQVVKSKDLTRTRGLNALTGYDAVETSCVEVINSDAIKVSFSSLFSIKISFLRNFWMNLS